MLKKIFSYGFIEGISKGLNKLTLLLLPLFISTIDYGKIGLLVSIEVLIPLVSFLGLERAVLRFYNEKDNYPAFLKSINTPVILFHIVLLIIGGILYFSGFRSVFGISIFPDIVLVIILVYLQGQNNIILNILRVEENHKNYFKGRVTLQVLKFILAVGLVILSKNYLGYIVGSIIAALITNFIFSKLISNRQKEELFNSDTFKKLFLFSWPFIFHGIATNLLGNADKFIIERILDMEKVGQYTFAYSLGTTITFAFLGISVFIEPMVYKEHDNSKRELLLDKFLVYTVSIGCIVYIMMSILSIYVLPLYFDQYKQVFYLIPLISLCYLVIPFYFKSNYKLIYNKKSKQLAILSIFSCTINIGLNFLLIPKYGLFSGVLSTFISYFVQGFLFNLMVEKKVFNIDLLYFMILSIIILLTLLFKINYWGVSIMIFIYILIFYLFKIKRNEV